MDGSANREITRREQLRLRLTRLGNWLKENKIWAGTLIALAVCLVLLRAMIRFTWITWEREAIAPTLIETPLWIPQLAMPLGMIVLVIAFLLELRGSILRLLGRAPEPKTESSPHFEITS